jgi:hypothetical protein
MTPTLQDIALLLGLFIDGQVVIFTSVRNQITLCEHVFRLTPPPFELKGVPYVLNGLRRHLPHQQMMLTTRSCRGIH